MVKTGEISLLVVDDEQVIRRLMRDVLSDEGYDVHSEGSTEKALGLALRDEP